MRERSVYSINQRRRLEAETTHEREERLQQLSDWGERERAPSCGLNGRAVTIEDIYIYIYIREYGSTLYIGIAMVFYCTFGPMQKLKFPFSLPYSTQFQFYQHQSE